MSNRQFTVWAPEAQSVDLLCAGNRIAMQASERGWWRAEAHAPHATEYCFSLNNGDPLPDPRSCWQPKGVNGPSAVVDHSLYKWNDAAFAAQPLANAIIYELHIGAFTPSGTFRSAIEKLSYLADLGITHVELMPVNQFPGDWGWGYDGVDIYAPHHAYGTPDDLKALVDACHQHGLAVLLDVVYNHFGPSGNYLPQFGPYFTSAYKTPWGPAVNFDHAGSHEVRRFFIDNACMWLRDYHFDGLRLDAVHAYHDESAIHFLEQLSTEINSLSKQLGRDLVLIAESDLNDPRVVTPREANGHGIDAQWSDDFHHALHTLLTGERSGYYEEFGDINQLAKSLQRAFIFDGIYSPHRDRIHGRPIGALSAHHFLAYSQNHDQIGNRARGERLSHLAGFQKAKLAAAVVLLSPFVPMIFQGEEFAASSPFQYFTHHDDEDLGRRVSEGRRNEFKAFGWRPEDVPDPQDPATFKRSKLNWNEVHAAEHAEMLSWYKHLIALRKSHPELTDGNLRNVHVEVYGQRLSMVRGRVTLYCDFATGAVSIAASKNLSRGTSR